MYGKKAEMRPANLFFIELTITLLFFALSAAVILKVFAAADEKQKISMLTERSVICAQSLAEAYSVCGDIGNTLVQVFGDGTVLNGDVLILDYEFMPSSEAQVILTLSEEQVTSDAGTLNRMSMCFSTGERQLFDMSCAAYLPKNGGSADG